MPTMTKAKDSTIQEMHTRHNQTDSRMDRQQMSVMAILRRVCLYLALLCGMLFAPISMASESTSAPDTHQIAGHCADAAPDQQAPAKQFHCMGGCSGIEASVTRFPARIASPLIAIPIPTAASLGAILLERDTPPPRRS
jgi:hypothetical protein